jgi:hypothetical protein
VGFQHTITQHHSARINTQDDTLGRLSGAQEWLYLESRPFTRSTYACMA